MANYDIPENPVYSAEIRKLENEDSINAEETFNPLVKRLVENTAAVKKETDGKADADLSNVSSDTLLGLTVGNAASVAWSGIADKPTTLAGFGITEPLVTTAVNVTMADGKTVEAKMAEIEAGSVLDFDLLCSSKGCTCATVESSSSYTETITYTAIAKKAAVRTTTRLSNGYKEVTTFYGEDGITVAETRTKTTTKTASGYKEVTA